MEDYIMYGITTVTGLIFTVFWKWVDGLKKSQEADRKEIAELRANQAHQELEMYKIFQSKEYAHKDSEAIQKLLEEIKLDVRRVQEKLDKKADKG